MHQISFKNNTSKSGNLYLVATPIGNLNDISKRAIQTLTDVDLILCEDSRNTIKLLNHFEIKNKLLSLHKFNESKRVNEIIRLLKDKKNLALVSDAGLPLISDPGNILITEILKLNINVIPIPGPSAFSTALIASGFEINNFFFYGFLESKTPTKKIKELSALKKYQTNIIFYESPNRLIATLKAINDTFGNLNICVAKELTKLYEQFYRGKVSEVIQNIDDSKIIGEFVIIIDNKTNNNLNENKSVKEADIVSEYQKIKKDYNFLSNKDIINLICYKFNLQRNSVYNIINKIKDNK